MTKAYSDETMPFPIRFGEVNGGYFKPFTRKGFNMTIIPKHLSLLIVFSLILCIGCEPETKVHVLSDPTDESAATQPQTEPKVESEAAELPAEVAEAEEEMPAEAPAETEEQVSADEVAVTVNGTEITESDLDKMIRPQLDRMLARTRGRKRPDNFIEDTRKRLHGQALDAAIVNTLVEQDLAKHNIVVTEEQINQHIQEMAEQQGMTVDDLKSLIEASGKTFEQWKEQMQFDKRLAVLELVKNRGLGDLEVTEAEAFEYYTNNKPRYEMPEQVKASHILIKPDTSEPDPEQADTEARKKAEELLAQIKRGADFAELAKANSDCPSAQNGGDLGFGQRRSWVGPFSDAAFALEPGQISDIVKTQFGYHIIKCTGRREAGTQSFDEVKNDITNMLRAQKHQELMMKYFELIKNEATIVYPRGKES